MRGTYEYAPIKFTLSKITTSPSGTPIQTFIDGDYECAASVSKPYIKGLPKGDYLLVYEAEFTELNPMRKVIISCYADDPVKMCRLCENNYPRAYLQDLNQCLYLKQEQNREVDTDIPI